MIDSLQIIPSKQITRGKKLGEGGFGIVFQGTWNYHQVAIKTLRLAKLTKELDEEFTREATIMTKLNNPCIVRLYGISKDSDAYAMVMEFMPGGDLYHLLADKDKLLPWQPLRWQIAIDIGAGLSYLHERKILHRDLKSLNVLLDKEHRAKITDFGLSKLKTQTSSIYTKNSAGSVPWMAPELFARRVQLTPAADVYAYGMVLWEIAARKIPFSDAHNAQLIPSWIKEGEREDIPKDCPGGFAQVIQSCWQANPTDRPTAKAALDALHQARPKQGVQPKQNVPALMQGDWNKTLPSPALPKVGQSVQPIQETAPQAPTLSDKTVKNVYDQNIQTIETQERVRALSVLDNRYLLSGSGGFIEIFDLSQGNKRLKSLRTQSSSILAIEVLPDGCIAVTGEGKFIEIWDLKGNQCVGLLKGHKDTIAALQVLQDGCLASGSNDQTIRIWDPKKRHKNIKKFKAHKTGISSLSILANGHLLSASQNGEIKIWDPKQRYRCVGTVLAHRQRINGLRLLKNGWLASYSEDRTVKIWDLSQKDKPIKKIVKATSGVTAVQMLPNGWFASVSNDYMIRFWDLKLESRKPDYGLIRSIKDQTRRGTVLTLSPTGNLISGSERAIKIWEIKE